MPEKTALRPYGKEAVKMKKRLAGFLLCAIMLFSPVTLLRLSAAVGNDFLSVADGIIAFCKAE